MQIMAWVVTAICGAIVGWAACELLTSSRENEAYEAGYIRGIVAFAEEMGRELGRLDGEDIEQKVD